MSDEAVETGTRRDEVPYHRVFSLTIEVFRKHGSVFDLPVKASPYEVLLDAWADYPEGRVLDFGCGAEKPLQKSLELDDTRYHSCDSDPSANCTYHSIEEITQPYDVVFANQVIEHLPYEVGVRSVLGLARIVREGGLLLVSVPNVQHPVRTLCNPTHVCHWDYKWIAALMLEGGLDPFLCARYNKTAPPRWYERPVVAVLRRVYRVDWCDSVFVLGRRPPGEEPAERAEG